MYVAKDKFNQYLGKGFVTNDINKARVFTLKNHVTLALSARYLLKDIIDLEWKTIEIEIKEK
jgi:hypothetical protein